MAIRLWMRLKPTTANWSQLHLFSNHCSPPPPLTHPNLVADHETMKVSIFLDGSSQTKEWHHDDSSIYIHSHRFHSYALIPSTLIITSRGNLYVTLSPFTSQLSKLDTAPLCLCDCCDCLNNSDPDVKSARLTCWETDQRPYPPEDNIECSWFTCQFLLNDTVLQRSDLWARFHLVSHADSGLKCKGCTILSNNCFSEPLPIDNYQSLVLLQ